MTTGKITAFDPAEKCGFIEPDDGGSSVFMHADDLGGLNDLALGTRVRFSVVQGVRWPRAYNVSIVTSDYAASNSRTLTSVAFQEDLERILQDSVPGISDLQVAGICTVLIRQAAERGWIEVQV